MSSRPATVSSVVAFLGHTFQIATALISIALPGHTKACVKTSILTNALLCLFFSFCVKIEWKIYSAAGCCFFHLSPCRASFYCLHQQQEEKSLFQGLRILERPFSPSYYSVMRTIFMQGPWRSNDVVAVDQDKSLRGTHDRSVTDNGKRGRIGMGFTKFFFGAYMVCMSLDSTMKKAGTLLPPLHHWHCHALLLCIDIIISLKVDRASNASSSGSSMYYCLAACRPQP